MRFTIEVKKKHLQVLLVCCAVLCASLGGYYLGVWQTLATYVGDLTGGWFLGKRSQFECSYMIEPYNSTCYQMVNGQSGEVYQSTNASKIGQFAYGNLTSGGIVFWKSGTYTLDVPITFANSATARSYVTKGEGTQNTIIQGSANCADESLFKSLQTSWTGAPRLILEDITLKGSGVELYLVDANFMLVMGKGDVMLRGALRGANDGIGIYQRGSGPPSTPSGFERLMVYPDSGTWDCGLRIHAENYFLGTINICASAGSVNTGVRLSGSNFEVGTIGGFVGSGKTIQRLLHVSAWGNVGSIFCATSGTPTTIPYMIKATGCVKIGVVITPEMPTGTRYTIGEDDDTMKSIIVDYWRHTVYYTSGGTTKENPDASYVLWNGAWNFTVDLSHWQYAKIKLTDGRGNEAGSGKGVAIYNHNDSEVLCEVTWSGSGYEIPRIGAWVDLVDKGATGTGQKYCCVVVKGSSATEDITVVYWIELHLANWRFPES